MNNQSCPQCGNKVKVIWNDADDCWSIQCSACGEILAWYWLADSAEEAMYRWNNRYEVTCIKGEK